MSAQDMQRLEIDQYEKRWMILTIGMLIVFSLAVGVSGFVMGFQVPGAEQRVNPNTVAQIGPFSEPGLRELSPRNYEAYVLGQAWNFIPNRITVPLGSTVTFYFTSKDVQHGVILEDSNLNVMIVPGEISKVTVTFEKQGDFNFICHEYCGVGHQAMYGTVTVE